MLKKMDNFFSWLAKLPPQLRSTGSYRISCRLATIFGLPDSVLGNMGISSDLYCVIPSTEKHLLFGRPEDYLGERGALELASELMPHSNCFVDIGAHRGYFSFFVKECNRDLNFSIYMFEPDEQLFDLLRKNIIRNDYDKVHMFKKAIGASNGTTTFYRNITSPLSGSLMDEFSPDHEILAVDMQVLTFQRFVDDHKIKDACVKVDVENAEFEFLQGALPVFSNIKYLIIEVLGPAIKKGFVHKLMNNFGLQAYYIDDYIIRHSVDGSFSYNSPQYNWLFCREKPDELQKLLAGNAKLSVGVS